ncbi:hypothetical protein CHUAL_006423 [Chamberlinius hualienensis]
MKVKVYVVLIVLVAVKGWGQGLLPHSAQASPDIEDYEEDYDYHVEEDSTSRKVNTSLHVTESSLDQTSVSTETPSHGTLKLVRVLTNVTKESGDSVKLRCEATGEPPPDKFRWFKNEAPVREEKGRVIIRRYRSGSHHGSRLKINDVDTHDTGYYRCEVSNGQQNLETTGILIVKMGRWGRVHAPASMPNYPAVYPNFPGLGGRFPGLPEDAESGVEGKGLCQSYRGTTCAKFVGNKTIHVKTAMSQSEIEEKLVAAFTVIASSGDLSKKCAEYAIPSLCYHAFPLCDEISGQPIPKPICRDECEILENDICRMEYAIAKKHPVLGHQLALPHCDDLPLPQSKEGRNCFRLGIFQLAEIDEEQKCYTGEGESYRGVASRTVSGLECLRWSRQAALKTSDFPELIGGHNFCRNPSGSESQPWCYTTDDHIRKEVCAVPKCASYVWLYVLVPTSAIGALLALLMAVWCLRCRVKSSKPVSGSIISSNTNKTAMARPSQQLEMNALLPQAKGAGNIRAREFPLSSIRFQQELGEGAFGKVYKGEVAGLMGDGSVWTPVAIKTLKANANSKTQQDFQRESDMMTDLRHPNIVCLLGVCMKEEPMCMLFEYMTQGDLHEFLITRSPKSDITVANRDDHYPMILEGQDFVRIASQIAAGMEYLSGHHYIHRDLATRNCLVGELLTVKISDFGLSRDIYSSDYYRVQSKSLLPVRWMPPESILYGKFTTDSDVWSFGVVLWEIWSYGLQPYYGCTNQEVVDMIRCRQLLPCPEGCPLHIYTLMVECWHEVASRRPTFKEIHARLRQWENMSNINSLNFSSTNIVDSSNCSATNLGTTGTISTSHSAASGSQHSSTGPSNNTGSSYLSNNLAAAAANMNSGNLGTTSSAATPYQRALMAVAQGLPPPPLNAQHQLQQAYAAHVNNCNNNQRPLPVPNVNPINQMARCNNNAILQQQQLMNANNNLNQWSNLPMAANMTPINVLSTRTNTLGSHFMTSDSKVSNL